MRRRTLNLPLAEIIAKYQNDLKATTVSLAAEYGVAHTTIQKYLKQAGVEMKKQGPQGADKKKLQGRIAEFTTIIRQLHADGQPVTLDAIGERAVSSKGKMVHLTCERVRRILETARERHLLPGVSPVNGEKSHGDTLKLFVASLVDEPVFARCDKTTFKNMALTLAGRQNLESVAKELGYAAQAICTQLLIQRDKLGLRSTKVDVDRIEQARGENRFLLAELARRKGWVKRLSWAALPGGKKAKFYAAYMLHAIAQGNITQAALAEKLGIFSPTIALYCRTLCRQLQIPTPGGQKMYEWGKGNNFEALKSYVSQRVGQGDTPAQILRDALTRKLLKLNEAQLQKLAGQPDLEQEKIVLTDNPAAA